MVFACALEGDDVVGVGQLVIEGSRAGVQCMATAPAHRRRGVAQALLSGLAREATRRDVEKVYLAVMANNHAATALYATAGFTPVHEYCYFTDQRA
jgi:ribosomal protein S18 acetylase RimI-like enzyme